MKSNENNRRNKTDTSLTGERTKADEYIDLKSTAVNKIINEKITKNRTGADTDKKNARLALDEKKHSLRNDSEISREERILKEDKELDEERSRSDKAQKKEREKEDLLRVEGNEKKEVISDTFLKKERSETDLNLLDERSEADNKSKSVADNLLAQTSLVVESKSTIALRDQFLAVVSHDLKNPLASISMATEIMKDYIESGEKESALAMVDMIRRNAKLMDRMITDLLDVERMTNGKLTLNLKKMDLAEILSECRLLLIPLVKSKGLTLEIVLPKDKVMAKVDHDKILQVLSNLVGNALKFTPAGGEIVMTLGYNPPTISVSDNGVGISLDDQAGLFDKFSQLQSADRSGLGLGLFISKWIVGAHKGTISVKSEPNKGSTFTVTF